MRSNNTALWILIILAMAVVVTLYFVLDDKSYSWAERYQSEGEQPYDLGVLKVLLKNNANGLDFQELEKPYNISLNEIDSTDSYNIIAVRRYFFPDTAELNSLKQFVESGNNLFISAKVISPLLPIYMKWGKDSVDMLYNHVLSEELYAYVADSILEQYNEVEDWSKLDSIHENYQSALREKVWEQGLLDSANVGLHAALTSTISTATVPLAYVYRNDTIDYYWSKIKLPFGSRYRTLATLSPNNTNAIVKWTIGDGNMYICATPLLFTNYYLRNQEHFVFTNELLGDLNRGNILYDEIMRFDRGVFDRRSGASLGKSPLSFILSQPALKWAWFTLLGAAFLFILFRSKRKQRIIPILQPNKNTTLAYAQLLGSLQLKEKNNGSKGIEIFQHFLQHLRQRNRWHSNEVNEELKKRLLKLAPDLKKQIEYVIYLGTKTAQKKQLTDSEVINLFNYTNQIIQRT
jgi:hypothetical protein